MERIYALDGTDLTWLDGILRSLPIERPSEQTAAFTFRLTSSGVSVDEVAVGGAPGLEDRIQRLVRSSSAESLDLVFRSGKIVATLSEYVWTRDTQHQAMFRQVTAGPPDVLGVVAHSGNGHGVVLNLPLDAPRPSTTAERRCWMRGAAHIGAASRLRKLMPTIKSFDEEPIEAIFDSSFKLHEARNLAAGLTARQALREAVCQIDKARRSSGSKDSDTVLKNWEALVGGRWSLIDRFNTDQRRFIIAIRNDPYFPDPRGLSQQERQVAEYVGLGRSAKEISYILGVPPASAENCARRAQAKLGLESRVELAAFFSPRGIRARLAEIAIEGDCLLIGSAPAAINPTVATLTAAEKSVLSMLIAGSSNTDIARRRATSVRTVANQVQAIFRKFHARSRCELMTRVAEP